MTDQIENSGNRGDDMAEYLQTFLDETEEQLDDLVETMLVLEREATNRDSLNEAFRLIHSIKGSAGMMGFDSITVLTHHLENRFEHFRSGLARLDEPTMNLVLRCIDFLRQCNNRLRDGEPLGSSAELLATLGRMEERAGDSIADESGPSSGGQEELEVESTQAQSSGARDESDAPIRMVVRFSAGLQLADLKAQLIVARLSRLGDVTATRPDLHELSEIEQIDEFEVRMVKHEDLGRLRAAADVDGVESITFAGTSVEPIAEVAVNEAPDQDVLTAQPDTFLSKTVAADASSAIGPGTIVSDQPIPFDVSNEAQTRDVPEPEGEPTELAIGSHQRVTTSGSSASERPTPRVAETMRVDIDRLDNLMNLAGELVVNRAHFVQIAEQISPALRRASMLNRVRDFSDSLRRTIESMENLGDAPDDWSAHIQQLRTGLELMDEQSEIWDNGRHCLGQISEAIDQLSRVSHSLQRGVLDTRMVPVGPLFNRFKRVVRDLSKESGKKVNLLIRGEQTELDKRMIDALGDPLMHLVRNSIDHGMEPPDVRARYGKSEIGTIFLEASHSGNNVFIHERDDGNGIDVERIKSKLTDKRLLSESAVEQLSDNQALDYIWHPGFSTATEVTDLSGRGVGMDAVKTRISLLNGTIDVDSTPRQGTTFTIRLPLTLAIVNSLLVRLRNVVFAIPIDDVREIVSVKQPDIVTVHGTQTFDVRGTFIPLVGIDDVFQWHRIDYGDGRSDDSRQADLIGRTVEVVILHAGGRTMGLRVDELLGGQDVVIKSLSDNFINIRGLSGASILGDGSVSLMLDVGTVIEMATRPAHSTDTRKMAT